MRIRIYQFIPMRNVGMDSVFMNKILLESLCGLHCSSSSSFSWPSPSRPGWWTCQSASPRLATQKKI